MGIIECLQFPAFVSISTFFALAGDVQNPLAFMRYKVVPKEYLNKVVQENTQLNALMDQCIRFISGVQSGTYDDTLSQYKDYPLAASLYDLKESLSKMRTEESEQKWISEGLAKFLEILRNDSNDLSKLSDQIISVLVNYVGVNQGALFVLNEEEHSLDLLSCYAYERKKFIDKSVAIGQGILGQAYLEKETVYITDIPNGYTKITSGLGHATPKSLLVVPLKLKDQVMGIVELASFETLPPYKIKFVEKVGESLASTIASVKVSDRTKKLLQESQQYSEELKSQEEEMRQNLEELQATQEELARKSLELERVRAAEKERTEKQLEAQKKVMEKVNKSFIEKEDRYKRRIHELEAQLAEFRSFTEKSPVV